MGRRFTAQMGAPLTAQSIEIAALEIRHDRQNRHIARQQCFGLAVGLGVRALGRDLGRSKQLAGSLDVARSNRSSKQAVVADSVGLVHQLTEARDEERPLRLQAQLAVGPHPLLRVRVRDGSHVA